MGPVVGTPAVDALCDPQMDRIFQQTYEGGSAHTYADATV